MLQWTHSHTFEATRVSIEYQRPVVSHTVYIMLDCPKELLETMHVSINKFVTRATNSWRSDKRIYNKPKNGGLGAINLSTLPL